MNENLINEESLSNCAKIFSVISNPIRIQLLKILVQNENLNVLELQKQLNISQPNLSHMLALMKAHGILQSRRVGKSTIYYPTENIVSKLEQTAKLWNKQ